MPHPDFGNDVHFRHAHTLRRIPTGSGKAISNRVISAAVACGLSRHQAAEVLAETIRVGVAAAHAPGRLAELKRDLERRTAALVIGLRTAPRTARGAA